MAKVSFTSLKLRQDINATPLDLGDNKTISIKHYVPIEEKADIINSALSAAEEELGYNEVLLDAYFHLYIVYHYTNLTFTEAQKKNELLIYDLLTANGITSKVIAAIGEEEYNTLQEYLLDTKNNNLSIQGAVRTLLRTSTESVELAAQQLNDFDVSKYQNVLDFVRATNNGNLPTLQDTLDELMNVTAPPTDLDISTPALSNIVTEQKDDEVGA